MRLWILGILICLSGAATAQQTSHDWSGPYVGISAGTATGWSKSNAGAKKGNYWAAIDAPAVGDSLRQDILKTSFSGGVEAGYSAQFGYFVPGFVVGFDRLGFSQDTDARILYPTNADVPFYTHQSMRAGWMASARAKLGVAYDNFLWDVSAGIAGTQIERSLRFIEGPLASNGIAEVTNTYNKAGLVLGTGLQMALSDNWSLKGEYLFAKFSKIDMKQNLFNNGGLKTDDISESRGLLVHLTRVGINYHF